MYPTLYHIYGPIYINCYGLAILIGIITFMFLAQKNKRLISLMSFESFKDAIIFGTLIGFIGGRLLWAMTDWNSINHFYDIFKIWEPGFSFLGTLISILIFIPLYLKKLNIPILPVLDIVSIYAPLLHAISRLGCFLAGCCHGIPTELPWGIIYTHPNVMVPENLKFIKIHPTQLYSSLALFIIFFIMYFICQNKLKKTGQLVSAYLIFASLERFLNDFWRSDRNFYNIEVLNLFSLDQWLALLVLIFAISLAIYSNQQKNYNQKIYESF